MFKRFRDPKLAEKIVRHIRRLAPSYTVKICHVCGTHEWTITHFGLRSLLPSTVDVIAGPGCPVCVTPAADIDAAIRLALEGVTITCFGDVLRVPGSELSLLDAKARGGDVRIVYSVGDAVKMAKQETGREFVFFAIGFETTAPSTAIEVLKKPPPNLSFLMAHRLIPPAMELLLGIGDLQIDGFIAPGHVSTIIGMRPYQIFPEAYGMPTVIAGFEPLDVLFAVSMILQQIREGTPKLENEYKRAVTPQGNVKAQKLMQKAFTTISAEWRGIGRLPDSGLTLNKEYEKYNTRKRYNIPAKKGRDLLPGCQCHLIMIGKMKPNQCKLFMKECTPESPKGPCMVSIEGTCQIWAKHSGRRLL
jgi:hydrogenase expression/formation protein HypD